MCLGAVLTMGLLSTRKTSYSLGQWKSRFNTQYFLLAARQWIQDQNCRKAHQLCWPRVYLDDDVLQDGGAWILTLPTLLLMGNCSGIYILLCMLSTRDELEKALGEHSA